MARKTQVLTGQDTPYKDVPQVLGMPDLDRHIVRTLLEYKREAKEARAGGPNPRDAKWEQNNNLYWNRHDFSAKAAWQAKETMPEVPSYVDRFAAAMKEALVASPNGFYDVIDPADEEQNLSDTVKRMMDVWLSQSGQSYLGTPLDFSAFFEEQMKMGAIMASAAVVSWKDDVPNGRVGFDTVDPRNVWLDPMDRGLYRFRRIEIDRHELYALAEAKSAKGDPLYNLPELSRLVGRLSEQDLERLKEQASGHGAQVASPRVPIVLDEYIATVLGPTGEVVADKSLMVVANDEFLIRGPERNPFWHGRDFLVYSPLIVAPLSVYGRSYMEDFGSIASTFTNLTNLILDAVYVSSMKVWTIVPGMLQNPSQAADGIYPNKVFLLNDEYNAKDFANALDMGTLDQQAFNVWSSLKSELTEAAGVNEIGLGQFAPNSRTSATEISATQQSSSAIVRSVAQTVETRFLNPLLDLGWKTGLQHMTPANRTIVRAAGDEMFQALMAQRKDIIKSGFTFQARGISTLIQKSQLLQDLLQLMQIVALNENLLAAFMQAVDVNKLLALLFDLSNVDPHKLQASPRDAMIRGLMEQITVAQQGPEAQPTPGAAQVQGAVRAMGLAR